MNNILQIRTLTYNLRSQTDFARFVNTNRFGLNSLRYFGFILPSDIKNANSFNIFKIKYGN